MRRLFDPRAFGDVKKDFFHDGENVVTFFHLGRQGTSTGNTSRLLIRHEWIVPKSLRRWMSSHTWQWEFHHHNPRYGVEYTLFFEGCLILAHDGALKNSKSFLFFFNGNKGAFFITESRRRSRNSRVLEKVNSLTVFSTDEPWVMKKFHNV